MALALTLFASACAKPVSDDASAQVAPAISASSTWSRDNAPRLASSGERAELTIATASPAALDELLAAAPKSPQETTDADGRSKVGTDTGAKETSSRASVDKAPEPKSARVSVGAVTLQPGMSSPAIERAARAQLYWPLVTRCKDEQGNILPPDSIRIRFNVDAEGYIQVPTIIVSTADARFEKAASCMRRELSTTSFRAPAAARGQASAIDATVPSVD